MTNSIRNLDEVRTNVRMLAVKQLLRSMVLQYGVDVIVHGLKDVYREDVWPRARGLDAVYQRMQVLDELDDRIQRLGVSHENVLRVPENSESQ